MPNSNDADGYNAGYAEQLFERQLRDRGLIPPSLADWMEGVPPLPPTPADADSAPAATANQLRLAAIAGALVEAYRDYGHLGVALDPLGTHAPGHPALQPEFHGITEQDLETIPSAAVGLEKLGATMADVVRRLREIYTDRIGYELDHMENPAQRDWLLDHIESVKHHEPWSPERQIAMLERLTEVEGMERFLHRSYLGQKRFSIEGLDVMVPMLDKAIERAAAGGTVEVVIGMAHRGRLNVVAHIIHRPYERILAEFEGERSRGLQSDVPVAGSGDVKYHLGAWGKTKTAYGVVDVYLAPNPSHLEHIDPVIEGAARAARELIVRALEKQAAAGAAGGEETPSDAHRYLEVVLPILIHGDAAFIGQGVVAETLNLCRLKGYEVGGTLHLIANNQLGFTTLPMDSRSSRYSSDLALGFRIPVLHVNADDPVAAIAATQLAVDYRSEFGEDIMIDVVGYRRYGHNEGDEPGYTQPGMYRKIADHPTVRELMADRMIADGIISQEESDAMVDRVAARLLAARSNLTESSEEPDTGSADAGDAPSEPISGPAGQPTLESAAGRIIIPERPRGGLTHEEDEPPVKTSIDPPRLHELNDALHRWPDDFNLFQKLGRQLEKRRTALDRSIDWAHAEALAFAGLLTEDVPIRLTGEDSERGTFSQRHLVLHDEENGRTWTPLRHLSPDQAPFEVWNSPLSEVAVLGFEYGYSTIATESLVLWEAQFGDFANVGQAIIDQFIAAGRSKWGQESRLVLLLPHGYEGQGPEHSSARLERFLQLGAERNLRVANPTTSAQHFHLLRLQGLRTSRRPLIVMTPKSLLRNPAASSPVDEFTSGRFESVLLDPRAEDDPEAIRRAVLCSGKVIYDLLGSESYQESPQTAVLRIERLYPFPWDELRAALGAFTSLEEIRWVQEEPANMGAWPRLRPWLEELAEGRPVVYAGRPERASPAEGYMDAHLEEQQRIVSEAFAT